jgi:hypothetical protein
MVGEVVEQPGGPAGVDLRVAGDFIHRLRRARLGCKMDDRLNIFERRRPIGIPRHISAHYVHLRAWQRL